MALFLHCKVPHALNHANYGKYFAETVVELLSHHRPASAITVHLSRKQDHSIIFLSSEDGAAMTAFTLTIQNEIKTKPFGFELNADVADLHKVFFEHKASILDTNGRKLKDTDYMIMPDPVGESGDEMLMRFHRASHLAVFERLIANLPISDQDVDFDFFSSPARPKRSDRGLGANVVTFAPRPVRRFILA